MGKLLFWTKNQFMLLRLSVFVLFFSFFLNASGQFSDLEPLTYILEYSKRSITFDCNSDGIKDVVIIADTDKKVYLYKGAENGLFEKQQKLIGPNGNATGICAADIDLDGDLDLVVSYNVTIAGMPSLIVYKNNDGNFTNYDIIDGQTSKFNLVISGDINLDGWTDLICSRTTSNSIVYYINNQGLGFTVNTIPLVQTVVNDFKICLKDINGDSYPDLVYVKGSTANLGVVMNNSGVFGNETIISNTGGEVRSLALEDIDNNGYPDILMNQVSSISSRMNNSGTFSAVSNISSTLINANYLNTTDINGDGNSDIVIFDNKTSSLSDDEILMFANNGNGTFSSANVMYNGYMLNYLCLLDNDINGPEFFLAEHQSSFKLTLNEQLNFVQDFDFAQDVRALTNMSVMDLDSDGFLDIFYSATIRDEVGYFKNNGNGVFEIKKIITKGITGLEQHQLVDFNSDGYTDIVVNASDGLKLITKDGAGINFLSPEPISSNQPVSPRFYVADFNNDGLQDAVIGSVYDGKMGICLNTGNNNLTPPVYFDSTSTGILYLEAYDINADGLMDVFALSENSGQLLFYKGIGNGTFDPPIVLFSGSLPTDEFRFVDFNLDGLTDIACQINPNLFIRYNLGNTNFSAPEILLDQVGSSGDFWLKDFNLDQNIDLLAQKLLPGAFRFGWFENISSTPFDEFHSIFTPGITTYKELSLPFDMDNDGDLDLVFSKLEDELGIFENTILEPLQIRGIVYYDVDSNGIKGINEPVFTGVQLNTGQSNVFGFTNDSGYFAINIDTVGIDSVLLYPVLPAGWHLSTGFDSIYIQTPANFVFADSIEFGLYPDSTFIDLSASFDHSNVSCGQNGVYYLSMNNSGPLTISGTIAITLHDSVEFITSNWNVDSIVGQSIYWTYDNLTFANQTLELTVQFPDSNEVTDTLNTFVKIYVDQISPTDAYFIDTNVIQLTCSNPYNVITANPIGISSEGFIDPETTFIDYTIYFQNPANLTSTDLMIEDQLDSNFDWDTIQVLASSDPYTLSIYPDGLVKFYFSNINLNTVNLDPIASQGFLQFRINLDAGLLPGTVIENSANLIFGPGTSVETNVAVNTLFDCISDYSNVIPSVTSCLNDDIFISEPVIPTNISISLDGSSYTQLTDSLFYIITSSIDETIYVLFENQFCSIDSSTVLSAYPQSNPFIMDTIICSGDSILFYGNYLTSSGTYEHTINNMNGCDSLIELNLSYITLESTFLDNVYVIPSDTSVCNGELAIAFSGNTDFLISINGSTEIDNSNSVLFFESLCPGIADVQIIDNCSDTSLFQVVIPSDNNYVYSNSFLDSMAVDSMGVVLSNCQIYYNTIDTAFIDSLWAVGNTVTVIWNIVDINGSNYDTITYELGNGTGVYLLQLSIFCPTKALEDYFTVTQAIYFNPESTNNLNELSSIEVSIFPNPTTNEVTIEFEGKNAFLNIFDSSERIIYSEKISSGELISLFNFEKGVYLFHIVIDDIEFIKRVVYL